MPVKTNISQHFRLAAAPVQPPTGKLKRVAEAGPGYFVHFYVFLFLDFEDNQDGASTGGYAAPSSPEFREKQLALFLEQAPEIDIVITTALIPNREAPELWTREMVAAMKPGSVIVD